MVWTKIRKLRKVYTIWSKMKTLILFLFGSFNHMTIGAEIASSQKNCSRSVCIPINYSLLDPKVIPVQVNVQLQLRQILGLDLDQRTVTVEVFTNLYWKDWWVETLSNKATTIDEQVRDEVRLIDWHVQDLRNITHSLPVHDSGLIASPSLDGTGSIISISTEATVVFNCEMNFNLFPFNKIKCDYVITSTDYDSGKLMFQANWSQIVNAHKLEFQLESDYEVQFDPILPKNLSASAVHRDHSSYHSAIGFQIYLKYRPTEALLLYYLPALILVLAAHLSFLIKPDGAPTRISLVTLSLTAVMNQFNTLNQISPKGGKGPTAAAIYLLTCVFSNCFCLGLNILTFRFKNDPVKFQNVNFYSALTSSISFLLFNLIYWPVILVSI